MDRPYPLIAVVGPTAAGKSELAVSLALGLASTVGMPGEIVNFDSVQLYSGFDIGSAKSTLADRRGVPHHLLDVAGAEEEITAGEYARRAVSVLADIRHRGNLPVLTGGTGFYLRALVDGLSPAPVRQPDLRRQLREMEARRPGILYRYLRRFDPASAERIHINDVQKLSRAVEITAAGKRPAAEIQAEPRRGLTGYQVCKLGLSPPRAELRERLNRRTEWMFANGLIEETERLLASGVDRNAKPMGSLGYRQALAVIESKLSLPDAITECQTRTRQYAKRQMTWFRADKDVEWLTGFGADPEIQRQALRLATAWILSAQQPSTTPVDSPRC